MLAQENATSKSHGGLYQPHAGGRQDGFFQVFEMLFLAVKQLKIIALFTKISERLLEGVCMFAGGIFSQIYKCVPDPSGEYCSLLFSIDISSSFFFLQLTGQRRGFVGKVMNNSLICVQGSNNKNKLNLAVI